MAVFTLVALGVFALFQGLQVDTETLFVPQPALAALAEEFEVQRGRPPDQGELTDLRRRYQQEEILFREALRRSLYLEDGMVRRLLVDRMRFALTGPTREPTEAELIQFYAEHVERYTTDARVTFDNLFFHERPDAPQAVLKQLAAGQVLQGDEGFWFGPRVQGYHLEVVRNVLGSEIALQLQAAETGQWSGPYRSQLGYHFLRLERLAPRQPLPYPEVRDLVEQHWQLAERERSIDAALQQLPVRYVFREL